MEDSPYRIIVQSGHQTVPMQLCENLIDQPVKIFPVSLDKLVDRVIDLAPDVILADATYGKIRDIRAACQLLHKQMNHQQVAVPPVLAVIEGNSGQRGEVLRYGAIDCVTYPFDPHEVMMRIEYSLLLQEACHQGLTPYRTSPGFYTLFADQPGDDLAKQTADYLLQHLAAPVTLVRIARQMHTNRTTLSKAFKQAFGCTIFYWLYERRMERAADYLLRTYYDIRQVAYRVGYPDANNFSTAFKKKFGSSPGQFRARHQKYQRNHTNQHSNTHQHTTAQT
ncbi:helix-turn-helix domain-containing protein [Vibrio quintilis]|uniref:Regulatory protein PchR n=1 Tax=Vibrio quintilis TaxID=1117707 RepID=A0A1M7Z129_9VIBR|nr:AraC family transcriptional regulator [Vibrio quintilis]SHO58647.1 Regulatory protein PchR [Vibrio quintilis]